MQYEWDEQKRKRNLEKHGYDFADIDWFDWNDWNEAVILEVDRRDVHERRYIAYGYIKERLTAVIFTMRSNKIRLISWRNASKKERKDYG